VALDPEGGNAVELPSHFSRQQGFAGAARGKTLRALVTELKHDRH